MMQPIKWLHHFFREIYENSTMKQSGCAILWKVMPGSKDIRRMVPHFVLSQSCILENVRKEA